MDIDDNGNLCFQNSDLKKVWQTGQSKIKKIEVLFNYILKNIGKPNVSTEYENYLKEKVRVYCARLNDKWQKSCRSIQLFNTKNDSWLQNEMVVKKPEASDVNDDADKPSSSRGRPRIKFSDMSHRSKRREATELSNSIANETELLMQVSIMSAKKEEKKDLVIVLKNTIESPTRPSKIRKMCLKDDMGPIGLSDEEALAFFLENNFTKRQYCNIRLESKQMNSDIFPSSNRLSAAKNCCRPNGVCVSETIAKVPLQQL